MALITATPFSPKSYDEILRDSIKNGWEVVSEGASGAQLKRPKKMKGLDKACLVIGIPLLLLFGIGLILIGIAILDYCFFTKESTAFLSRDNPTIPKI